MIYCFDTHYYEDKAQTACIGISEWQSNKVDFQLTETISGIREYESGAFYKRELPCLISILKNIPLLPQKDILVIDGFVVLDDHGKSGLGDYLFDFLNSEIPVIGVAKNNFASINKLKREVFRGKSINPLYVTSKGINLEKAQEKISMMHGEFRIPTILKLVDQHCRQI